jgi:hypothetical protein
VSGRSDQPVPASASPAARPSAVCRPGRGGRRAPGTGPPGAPQGYWRPPDRHCRPRPRGRNPLVLQRTAGAGPRRCARRCRGWRSGPAGSLSTHRSTAAAPRRSGGDGEDARAAAVVHRHDYRPVQASSGKGFEAQGCGRDGCRCRRPGPDRGAGSPRPAPVASCQLGQIHRRSPKRMGSVVPASTRGSSPCPRGSPRAPLLVGRGL